MTGQVLAMIMGGLCFIAGFLSGYLGTQKPKQEEDQEEE